MALEQKQVTLEEYDRSLRDSVNAYYVHAMNDPSMSREDVIRTTSEMADKYLDAVQEFRETASLPEPETGNSAEQEIGNEEGTDENLESDLEISEDEIAEDGDDPGLDEDGLDP